MKEQVLQCLALPYLLRSYHQYGAEQAAVVTQSLMERPQAGMSYGSMLPSLLTVRGVGGSLQQPPTCVLPGAGAGTSPVACSLPH